MWWWCTVGNNPLDGRQTHVCIFCWQGGTVKEQIVCDSKILICYIVILITIFLILHMFAHPLSLHLSIHRKIDVPFFVLLSLATTYSWFLSKKDMLISFCLQHILPITAHCLQKQIAKEIIDRKGYHCLLPGWHVVLNVGS